MQTELATNHPLLDIQIVGVNRAGLESGNAEMTDGRNIPWLQDMDHDGDGESDVWANWGAGHLDLLVLDGNNQLMSKTNLGTNSLDDQENYVALRDAIIDMAMMSQKPWHNAEDPLDIDHNGVVVPLDALIVINRLNSVGSETLPAPVGDQPLPFYYDANGDGDSTPLDALLVINSLNAQSPAGAGEGEPSPQLPPIFAEDVERAESWWEWMSTEGPSAHHALGSSTFAPDTQWMQDHHVEPPSDEAHWMHTDQVFAAAHADWLSFDSESRHDHMDLDLMGEVGMFMHM